LVDLGGARSALQVPLCKDDTVIGIATIYRQEVQAFDERQIALLQSFAAQAVIAIQNARLLSELRASLEQQTATAEVLKTISRSAVNLETVLDTLVETVARLCRADQSYMFRSRDGLHRLRASHGLPDEAIDYLNNNPFEPNEGTTSGRVVLQGGRSISAMSAGREVHPQRGPKGAGFPHHARHSLMAQDKMVGVFVVSRTHVEPFSEKEIALATASPTRR
jgi:GAF domain-containing protein